MGEDQLHVCSSYKGYKPERLLEPCFERGLVGGRGLTELAAHPNAGMQNGSCIGYQKSSSQFVSSLISSQISLVSCQRLAPGRL